MGNPNIILYYTSEVFVPDEFNEQSILMKSLLVNQQFDEYKPSFIKGEIHKNLLEDETNLIQLGYAEETYFIDYNPRLPEASAWNVFPTKENPKARYKFISVEFSFSYDQTLVQR